MSTIILFCFTIFVLFICALQLFFLNWNLKEIIVLLCRISNNQEALRDKTVSETLAKR